MQVKARGHVSSVVVTPKPPQPRPPLKMLTRAAEGYALGELFGELIKWLLGGGWRLERRRETI
jgi:hypothetical protein